MAPPSADVAEMDPDMVVVAKEINNGTVYFHLETILLEIGASVVKMVR
jgi:hypothetical protein